MGWNLIIKARKPARVMIARLERLAGTAATTPSPPASAPAPPSLRHLRRWAEELAAVGVQPWTAGSPHAERRADACIRVSRTIALRSLAERSPDTGRATIDAAERVLPARVRPARQRSVHARSIPIDRRADGYQPIDWYLDPIAGLRFPRGVPYKRGTC